MNQKSHNSASLYASGPQEPRLLWLIVALAAFGLLATQVLWLVPTLEDARENAARLRLEVGARAADSVLNFIDGKIAALNETARVVRFNESSAPALLGRLLKEHAEFNAVSLADRDLIEYLRVSRLALPEQGRLRTLSELNAFAAGGDPVYIGSVRRSENLEPLVSVAVPALFAGGDRQFLFAELNLKVVSQRVSRFGAGRTGKVYIVDQEGTLIIDPNLSLVLKRPNLSDRAVVHDVIASGDEVRFATHLNEQGIAVEASGIFLSQVRWGVVSEQLAAETHALRNRIILLAIASLAIGFFLLATLVVNARKIVHINRRLREILRENYDSAKMLVRRDRDLTAVNTRLQDLLYELESVGKMLVRRDLELTRANARLEELDAIKSEFVSIAAHQLRTPLTGIRWSYQTILDRDAASLTQEQRRLLESGLGATMRMIDLVNDLLSVARIEEGRFGIRLRTQSITPLLEQMAARYTGFGKEKGIKFLLVLPDGEAVPDLAFDEERIEFVLDNLMDNALKYTEPGGTVTVRALRESDRVRIEVQDTGVGIPPTQLSRVFTKFFRADNAIRLHTSGTGLGLYVAKNIIEKHDGVIEVTSKEGTGSTFAFTLPIV